MDILFIGKKGDENTVLAANYVKQLFPTAIIVFGERKDKFPQELRDWKGDYVFSYLSPWIIPTSILENTRKGAINWHPGPPEYPGIGCTNFAIYNNEAIFGITCHYMAGKVDTGNVIEVKRFSVLEKDTVYSITQKCYAQILSSFYSILEKIVKREELPSSEEHWTRKPYTRKELNELCLIENDMSEEEIKRRIKATTYDRPWAYTVIKGEKFYWRE